MNGDRCPRGIYCCKTDESNRPYAKKRKRRWIRRMFNRIFGGLE